jgi:hypothetical protein
MAQPIVPGPFRIHNFANNNWFNPNAPLPSGEYLVNAGFGNVNCRIVNNFSAVESDAFKFSDLAKSGNSSRDLQRPEFRAFRHLHWSIPHPTSQPPELRHEKGLWSITRFIATLSCSKSWLWAMPSVKCTIPISTGWQSIDRCLRLSMRYALMSIGLAFTPCPGDVHSPNLPFLTSWQTAT